MTNPAAAGTYTADLAQWNLPETEVATAALTLVTEVSSPVLTNHCVRSYLFGREIAAAQNLRSGADYDDETVYLACLLHDLGLTDYGSGAERFEIQGADAAARFLSGHDVAEDQVTTVWQSIALHSSLGLNNRFGAVQAISGAGISFDIDGMARDLFSADFLVRVEKDWPRLNVGYALSEAIASDIRAHADNPMKAPPFTLPGHLNERVNSAPHAEWAEFVAASGWGDQPPQ